MVLCVVGTTSTPVSARSTPQDVPLRLRLALQAPLTCRQQVNLAEAPSTSTFGTQVMTEVPVTTTYVMTFAPGKSVAARTARGSCLNRPILRLKLPSQSLTQSFSDFVSWRQDCREGLPVTRSTTHQLEGARYERSIGPNREDF